MPLEVFYSYSHKDAALREELDVHLSQLVHDGLIVPWTDRRILAGDEWQTAIDAHVRSAHIILLLVSPEFLASDYCYGIEMKTALERHAKEQAVVIPIILRPVDWHSAPFAALQALPRDGKAVTLWRNRDEAFAQIAQAIREVVTRYQDPKPEPLEAMALHDRQVPRARVVDAAMPAHVVKDRATELLVLIRLPESKGLAGILQEDEEAEARPEDVRSRPFDVVFPLGPTGLPEPLKIAVQLTSPDFSPPSQTKNIFVPVRGDSQVCPFLLTPQRTGSLLVVIELIWEDAERGYRRLKTTCVADAEAPAVNSPPVLVQMEVGVGREKQQYAASAAAAAVAEPRRPVAKSRPPVGFEREIPSPAPHAGYAPMRPTSAVPEPPPKVLVGSAAPQTKRSPQGFLSKPFVRAAMAVCLLTIGSSVFLIQKSTTTADQQAPALSKRLSKASLQLEQVSKTVSHTPVGFAPAPTPVVAAAIREGQTNLIAARAALAKGNTVEAKKHLAKVEAVNSQLLQIEKQRLKTESDSSSKH